ncbi:MAG TPA: hypothetical protein VK866_13600, partial [Acidimicrobiales bacterium]|nr:hypothetical protein [Acidimicrobiales bacterium]
CGFSWDVDVDSALAAIAAGPERYDRLLDGRDGMVPPADGIRWIAHELVHHELDVDARASQR